MVASAGSKTIEGGPRRLMSRSPKGREKAGACFARAEESPAFGKHCMTWERSCECRAVQPRILVAAERPGVSPGRVGPGRTESRGDRTVPCARAVEARDGNGLPGQAALRSPVVAGPMTASGHQYLHDDAGEGMIWTVCPVPKLASGCGLRPVAKPSWRRSWGGPMGPAGESGPRRTPPAHDKGARGPNGCGRGRSPGGERCLADFP